MNASKLVGAIGLIAVVCGLAYIALIGEPRLQIDVANGAYSNPCCGSVVLRNGIMTVAHRRIGYVIERDKVGPYVLPTAYVGASNRGFVIKPSASALILRLDDPEHPQRLELVDVEPNGQAYPFKRTSGG